METLEVEAGESLELRSPKPTRLAYAAVKNRLSQRGWKTRIDIQGLLNSSRAPGHVGIPTDTQPTCINKCE